MAGLILLYLSPPISDAYALVKHPLYLPS